MKLRSFLIRCALGLAAAISLATLSACSTGQSTAPGPHQGNSVPDGKDHRLTSPGPHQGG